MSTATIPTIDARTSLSDEGPDWRRSGACRFEPDSHILTGNGSAAAPQAARAIHVCKRHCPVRAQCHADAQAHPQRIAATVAGGVWWVRTPRHDRGVPSQFRLRDPGHGAWCERAR